MKQEYMEAFTEVNEIIKLMPDELINKIPNEFREMINEERDMQYKTDIKEPLEKCKLKNETIIILGLIYRDFLCSRDERKKLQEKDAKELQKVQQEIENDIREKYNIDNIFEKKKEHTVDDKIIEETAIVVAKKEKWYKKIFNIIKGLFYKN